MGARHSPPKVPQAIAPKPPENPDAAAPPAALKKRTRASKPKVRTGCRTCKIRRVKCDEAKPMCQQCQRARVICDGYHDTGPSTPQLTTVESNSCKPKAKPTDANILVNPSRATRRFLLPRPSSYPRPRSGPSSRKFSAQEVPYFDLFRHKLTDDLSGYSCTDFWTRVVLCEAMTNNCVRHAVLAIAALSQGISDSLVVASSSPNPSTKKNNNNNNNNKPSALFPWTAKSIVNSNHRTGLRHYVEALSMFRKQVDTNVNTEVQSPRAVLIMTILLITFELLQGNMETVDVLLTSSIHLLKGSLSQYRRDTSPIQFNSQARGWTGKEDDLHDIEYMLPFLSIMGGWTPFLKTQRTNLALWDTSARGDDAVPNLAEHQSTKQLQADWCRFFARASAFTGQALTAVTQQRPVGVAVDLDPALLHEQQRYLSHLGRWRDVLDAALARAATSHDSQANNRAIRLMQLHRLVLSIGMQCCLDPTDMLWDAYDDEFLALVEGCLAFAVEAATKPTAAGRSYRYYYYARFTFGMGVLSTLGPVIAKCRNHDIRMRALEMARRMPWREGAWDAEAELFGKLGAVLLEERGRNADDGVVWAENRWTWVDGDWDMERRKLVGRYVRSVPDRLTGDHVVTSLEVNLDAWPDVCRDVSCEVDHAAECRVLDY
ncbi:hypothetical protein B0T24DRAFT_643772 [Lasiosphaeria ovina]|uniref:Zn(2)-C6 fungal-type domain-containing protein n=1 Tax=Lasiosphaeria ovina TaxID=92902 RepID=A0AAE0JSC0_9PEZI|nr:hypothetical protein B0T24DRAFT_643772 [Lasiosphaeria ovina]